jgi:hypothetical protein
VTTGKRPAVFSAEYGWNVVIIASVSKEMVSNAQQICGSGT